jgi:hypothetical protein
MLRRISLAPCPPVEVPWDLRKPGVFTKVLIRAVTGLVAVAAVCAAFAQKYDGPRPPKPDVPYLKHADNLVATEVAQAKEEKRKDDTVYTIEGANSSAKTPLAEPIFVFQSVKLLPDKLQLFKLEIKNGHREIAFSKKKGPEPIRVEVTRLSSDNLYKLEVDEQLAAGEYSLSPEGSNQVFCFSVF